MARSETVKCKYCGKIIGDVTDTCPTCGAPVPKIKPPKTIDYSKIFIASGVFFVLTVGIVFFSLFGGNQTQNNPSPTPIVNVPAPPEESVQETPLSERAPHEVITDNGVRQALELIFRREINQITWDELNEIQTLYIHTNPNSDVDTVIMSTEAIALSDLPDHPHAIEVQTDAVRRNHTELTESLLAFPYLSVLHINAEIPQSILETMPQIQELSVNARNVPDLTPFSVLPNLERLTISGGNFESLQGISDLNHLYALHLQSTGIRDLSILSQQQNIRELSFVRNRELTSLHTLQDMTWLRSLYIERSSEEINFQFIQHLTSLESLYLIHTDTRTYDFIVPLVNLRQLTLFRNNAALEIPDLSGFTQLEHLTLEVRRNTGVEELANTFHNLTALRRANLYGLDSLEPLRGMTNLEELEINIGGRLTDVAALGTLENLHTLRMSSGMGSANMQNMNAIAALDSLRILHITSESRGLWFQWDFLYTMTQLEELKISGNMVVGNFANIQHLTNLRVLHMDDIRLVPNFDWVSSGGVTHIHHPDPVPIEQFSDALANLSSLEVLTITENRLQDISFVANLQNLRYLNAAENYITDLSPLTELSNLAYANVRRNPIGNWEVVSEMINTSFVGR